MSHRTNLIYVLADGAHARFVQRSRETGDFTTVQELDGSGRLAALRAEQRDEGPGRAFESATSARHGVGREDVYRRAKAEFAARVAEALGAFLEKREVEGVVLAAPPRLLHDLRKGLPSGVRIVAELGKDLVKTPDHELGAWLVLAVRLT